MKPHPLSEIYSKYLTHPDPNQTHSFDPATGALRLALTKSRKDWQRIRYVKALSDPTVKLAVGAYNRKHQLLRLEIHPFEARNPHLLSRLP